MKSMIKGIDILLYAGDDTEVISNVLVGNSATADTTELTNNGGTMQTFTLAIPKGDTHDWTDRTVEFFGQKFRTVGVPLQGIEENIPLCWHKQVRVQKMNVSGNCTVYDGKTFEKHSFGNVYFYDNRGETTLIDGIKQAGSVIVQIYADRSRTDDYKPKLGDIVVLGNCVFVFDTATQQSISQSMAQFRATNKSYAVINDIKNVTYGQLPDYIITAN